jgi:hypothetical protein
MDAHSSDRSPSRLKISFLYPVGLLCAVCSGLLTGMSGGCREDDCLGQDVEFEGACQEVLGYAISACNNCYEFTGCTCLGADCDQLFETRSECEDFVGGAECDCK